MQGESGDGRSTARVRAAGTAVLLAVLAACGGGGGGVGGNGGLGGAGAAANLGSSDALSSGSVNGSSGGASAPLAAQLQPADFTVNTTTAGDQGRAAVAPLPGGGFVAVWSTSAGGASDVRLQRFGADNRAVGAEQVVSTTGSSAGVTPMADGGFLVSWSASPYMYEANGHAQRFDAQGAPVGGPVQLVATFFKYVSRPLGLPDGSYVLAADTTMSRFGPEHGQVTRYAASGTVMGTPVRLTSQLTPQTGAFDPNWAGSTSAARWPDGRFAVAWIASGTGVAQVRLTRFDAQANEVATDTVASGTVLQHPAIAVLAGGGFALSWVSGAHDATKTLWLEAFGADGVSFGRQAVASDLQAAAVVPRLAALDTGGFVLGWKSVNYDATAMHRTVSVQRFGAGGQASGGAEAISAVSAPLDALTFDVDSLDVLGGSAGSFLVVHGAYAAATGWDVRASTRR